MRPLKTVAILGLAAVLLVATGFAVVAKPDISALVDKDIDISAARIELFDTAEPETSRFGKLTWRGGLAVSSPSSFFGGFSGLAVSSDGKRLAAVSDAGFWLTAEIAYDGDRPKGLRSGRVGPLGALKGRKLERRRDRDAEALVKVGEDRAGMNVLVAFEQNARIGRFRVGEAGFDGPSSYLDLPKSMRKLNTNSGLEAVTVLTAGPHRGALIGFAERRKDNKGHRVGWMVEGDNSQPLLLEARGNYDVSDMTAMPDGGFLVLERRFRWSEGVHMRIRRVRPAAIRIGVPIKAEVLLEASGRYAIDNMEGIAVHRAPSGDLVLTLISDDNFSFFQRTLLLQFTLPDEPKDAGKPTG